MSLDHLLVNLPNGMSMTFIGKCRGLDAQTVELCAPDGRPILQVPRSYVTETTEAETVERIVADVQHRRNASN